MIQDIKSYFFTKRLEADSSKHKAKLELLEFKDAKKIGIAYDASDYSTITKVRDLEMRLKKEGKNVNIFAYINSNDKKFEPFLFTRKDLNWFGYPKKQQLFDFANIEFDMLLGIFKDTDSPLNAIFAKSKSKLRVGVNYSQSPRLYDLIIGTKKVSKTGDILEILVNFLTSIRTK